MRSIALLLTALLLLDATVARASTQRTMTAVEEQMAWREATRTMAAGSVIKVELSDGRRLTGTLIAISEDELLLKERSSRPALAIPMLSVTRIEPATRKGVGIAKAIAAGAAAGAGAFLTFFALALITLSD
jgi:hypothetical protein